MNLMQALRSGMLNFRGGHSSNNRAMTPGRVAEGKSTFKGTPAEELIVYLEKKIEEIGRMIFAIDIKIEYPQKMNDWEDSVEIKAEKQELMDTLEEFIEYYTQVAPQSRFEKFIKRMDEEDTHRREIRNMPL